jgi:phosphoribosylanthranilate isomerase
VTRIKICGNTRAEDVEVAVQLGADLLGFIFTRSKRQVRVDEIKDIIAQVPAGVERVGVFIDEPTEEIGEVAQSCGLTAIQVYRPLTDMDRALGLLLLPAFRVQDGEDLASIRFAEGDHPLFDTWMPDTIGGTGRAWSWPQAREVARKYPLVVSGGLTPVNVDRAVRELHPWAVDVCSGVEEEPGRKDHAKLRAFVAAVRRVDRT